MQVEKDQACLYKDGATKLTSINDSPTEDSAAKFVFPKEDTKKEKSTVSEDNQITGLVLSFLVLVILQLAEMGYKDPLSEKSLTVIPNI